jgi:Htaa
MSLRSLAGILLALGCLFFAPLARADYDPLGSGTTKLTLDKSFLALLAKNGVKLSATAPAKLKGGAVTFPVSGGKFDPTAAKGTVEHEGALVFKAGNKSVPIKALQLKTTQKHSPLSAKVGGSQLKLAGAKSLTVTRSGFGNKVKVQTLTLSSKLATRLGKKLRLKDVFKEGLPLGQTLTSANPVTIALLGQNKAAFSFDPGIEAKLRSLFVAVNPIFPAEHIGAQFTLPIFGGTIAPDASQGTLETSGSLEFLQLGGGQVFWAEDWLDLAAKTAGPEVNVQPSPPFPGKLGRTPVATFAFTAPALADAKARTVTVNGAALALGAATAATFNELFAKPQGKDGVFVAGEALGTISFTAQGQ